MAYGALTEVDDPGPGSDPGIFIERDIYGAIKTKMKDKIAMGFHACVDYELIWNTETVEQIIRDYNIRADELRLDVGVHTERDAWIFCLAHLQAGIGGEIVPDDAQAVVDFAEHFDYKVTLGGTPTRAAIVLDKLGYKTALQTSCWNRYVRELLPDSVTAVPGTVEDKKIYPHVVLQCAQGTHIYAGDISFTTPRENRIMISRDDTSLDIPVKVMEFGPLIRDAGVFLLGCFSEVIDRYTLDRLLEETKQLLDYLPKDAVLIYEDGCYVVKAFRYYAQHALQGYIDVLSMNEDELQEYIGQSLDILDAPAVSEAIRQVYEALGVETLVVHTAKWALAYGPKAQRIRESLIGGTAMATTRFRLGDDFTEEDYEESKKMEDREDATIFCDELRQILGRKVCVIPSKDMSHVENPTVVGLGDSFAGGFLPGLMGLK